MLNSAGRRPQAIERSHPIAPDRTRRSHRATVLNAVAGGWAAAPDVAAVEGGRPPWLVDCRTGRRPWRWAGGRTGQGCRGGGQAAAPDVAAVEGWVTNLAPASFPLPSLSSPLFHRPSRRFLKGGAGGLCSTAI